MENLKEILSSKEEEIKNLQEKVSDLEIRLLVATKPLTDDYMKGIEVFATKMKLFWKEMLDELQTTLKKKEHELVLLENVTPKAKLDYCVELLAVRVSEAVISDFCSSYKDFASEGIVELSRTLVQKQLDYDSLVSDIEVLSRERNKFRESAEKENEELYKFFKEKRDEIKRLEEEREELMEAAKIENEEMFKFFNEKRADVMRLEDTCEFLSTKAKDLAREHLEKLSKADEEREVKLKKLERDTDSLSTDKATLAGEVDSLNNEKVILVSDVEKLRKDKAMLASEIELHKKEKSDLATAVEFLNREKAILVSDAELLKEDKLVLASAAEYLKKEKASLSSDVEVLRKEKVILSSDSELLKKEKAIVACDVGSLNREKEKLQGDVEFLNEEKNEFVRSAITDVGQSMQEEIDERDKALADSEKALEELRVLYQTVVNKERWSRDELQEIRQELIKVLGSEKGSRNTVFGVKRTKAGDDEFWNYRENRRATMKEVISHLTKN
ncbi:hypothetical protein MKW94_012800 [Papaver nudicaule]|uniref:Uncharacterized protein n=1 Tax=Papaver nudicaule TaxID=74823 RepID=A0AA41RVW1_PAPNU|nr:hypothetical protein [Papaver nudicaule]